MPASKLCLARQKKVQILAQLFFSNLCKPEHLQQIKDTGALTPTYSMRHRCTRERERGTERERECVCVVGNYLRRPLVHERPRAIRTRAFADSPCRCCHSFQYTRVLHGAVAYCIDRRSWQRQRRPQPWITSRPKPGIRMKHLSQPRTVHRGLAREIQRNCWLHIIIDNVRWKCVINQRSPISFNPQSHCGFATCHSQSRNGK